MAAGNYIDWSAFCKYCGTLCCRHRRTVTLNQYFQPVKTRMQQTWLYRHTQDTRHLVIKKPRYQKCMYYKNSCRRRSNDIKVPVSTKHWEMTVATTCFSKLKLTIW